MSQELRLRYLVQLASNIGVVARQDAQQFEEANRRMQTATQRTGRDAGTLERTLRQLGAHTGLERQVNYFDRLAASVSRARDQVRQLNQAVSTGVQALPRLGAYAAGGAASVYAAGRVTEGPMAFDYRLRQAALTAYGERGVAATLKGVGSVRGGVNAAVRAYGGSRDQALTGFQSMIGSGEFKGEEVEDLLPAVQEAAVGTATEVSKLASLVIRMKSVMKIGQKDIRLALSRMTRVGQMGGVELDQQAGFIADLAGQYGALGYEGQRGAVAASVDLQLAYKTAGSAESARTILENFYGKTLAADTAKDFAKLKGRDGKPIDLYAEIAARRAKGQDGVEAFLGLSDEVLSTSGGDKRIKEVLAGANINDPAQREAAMRSVSDVFERAGLSSFIQDKEAMRGYLAIAKQRDVRKSMIGGAMADTGQTMNTISSVIQDSPEIKKQKAIAESVIAAETAFQSLIGPIGGVMTGAAELAQEFPKTAAALAGVAAASAIAAAGLGAIGLTGLLTRGPGTAAGAGALAGTAPALASRLSGAGRFLGPLAAVGLLGVQSYGAITDDQLTAMGKARGVGLSVAGAGGAWGGAAAGAAIGTMALPGIGTFIGGLAGGAAGYWGGKEAMGSIWGQDPKRDFVRATDPNGNVLGQAAQGGVATVELGQGQLQINVQVSSDGTPSVSTSVTREIPLIKIDAGSTNPGSFAAASGGGR